MTFWLLLATLLVFSSWGAVRFSPSRRRGREQDYAAFIYVCVLLFAALPLTTGDGRWSLVLLPLGLIVGTVIVRRASR